MTEEAATMPAQTVSRRHFTCAKSNAKRRGIQWDLTFQEFSEAWIESGRYAHRGRRRGEYQMDRIDPLKGYSKGNVQIVAGMVNRVKDSPHGHVAKLSEADVVAIRKAHVPRVVTHAMLAAQYGVTRYCIKSVMNRTNWKSL